MINLLEKYQAKATQLDIQDPLKQFRRRFALPKDPNTIYFCNNSLGLPAVTTFTRMQEQLQRWSQVGSGGMV